MAASGQSQFDPVSAYGTWDYMIEHAYTRQLVQYPTVPYTALGDAGWLKDTTPTADVATQVPTASNGGITDNGTTYTFHIKKGVEWNNGRQVTSQDFLREYKAFGNPVQPVGNSGYFLSTIAGFKSVLRRRDRVLRQEVEQADRGQHREFPELALHLRHHDAELLDDRVPPDRAGR